MKRTCLSTLALATVLLLGACTDGQNGASSGDGFGRILFHGAADGTVGTRTRGEIDLSQLGITVPAPEAFALELTSPALQFNGKWPTVNDFNTEEALYQAGSYTAIISHGSPDEEGPNKPYFYGEKEVTVVASETTHIEITASVANSLTEVRTTEAFDRYFHDAQFTITTAAGNAFTFTPTAATPANPVFVQAGATLTVTGTARRQSQTGEDNGPEITFTEQRLDATVARTRHIFTFDAADAGSATLHITLDENEEITLSLDIELNENA